MRNISPGLFRRGGIYHVGKQILGRRIRESTGERTLEAAEQYLAKRVEEIRQARVYGVRPEWTFREASLKYVQEADIATLRNAQKQIKLLDTFIGTMPIKNISMDALRPFIKARKAQGVKNRTVNFALETVRRILNLAADEWRDEQGLTWLDRPPKIKLLKLYDARRPYPLSWEEQSALFGHLSEHLRDMALFKVNTGCRDGEVCNLRWNWEVPVPHLDTSVFLIPGNYVKNRQERLVVLNKIAASVIKGRRGIHPTHVFTFNGKPIRTMNNSSWKNARVKANLTGVRVHDLKHTFGRRLRATGASFETRQDLLGHSSGRITTHYSAPELQELINAVGLICEPETHKIPTIDLTWR
jgi:integrase